MLDRNIGHEGAGTLAAAQEALVCQLLIGGLHGQSREVQNAGQLARGRKPGSRRQCAAQDRFPDAVFQLRWIGTALSRSTRMKDRVEAGAIARAYRNRERGPFLVIVSSESV